MESTRGRLNLVPLRGEGVLGNVLAVVAYLRPCTMGLGNGWGYAGTVGLAIGAWGGYGGRLYMGGRAIGNLT